MRDLQGIAEINGPRRAELQAERAANILDNHPTTPAILAQIEHSKRAEARQARNDATLRAVSAPGVAAFYGEYRTDIWHRVRNSAGNDIIYYTPEFAIAAAKLVRESGRVTCPA